MLYQSPLGLNPPSAIENPRLVHQALGIFPSMASVVSIYISYLSLVPLIKLNHWSQLEVAENAALSTVASPTEFLYKFSAVTSDHVC